MLTGSTLQDLRTIVHFWTAQRSAAQNVKRIYTGYVANPPNKEESYLLIYYSIMELKEMCVDEMALYGQKFPIKTLWKKLFTILETFFQTRLWKKGRKFPGISALWNTSSKSWKCYRLADNFVQEWEKWLQSFWMHFIIF